MKIFASIYGSQEQYCKSISLSVKMDALSNLMSTLKQTCDNCCTKKRKSLTCGSGVFSDGVLVKKEVEFVLPPNAFVETTTSEVQTRYPSPDWKDGLTDPERTLRDLVDDHRRSSHSEDLSDDEVNLPWKNQSMTSIA